MHLQEEPLLRNVKPARGEPASTRYSKSWQAIRHSRSRNRPMLSVVQRMDASDQATKSGWNSRGNIHFIAKP